MPDPGLYSQGEVVLALPHMIQTEVQAWRLQLYHLATLWQGLTVGKVPAVLSWQDGGMRAQGSSPVLAVVSTDWHMHWASSCGSLQEARLEGSDLDTPTFISPYLFQTKIKTNHQKKKKEKKRNPNSQT